MTDFNLHTDVTSQKFILSPKDRFLISDENSLGKDNAYIEDGNANFVPDAGSNQQVLTKLKTGLGPDYYDWRWPQTTGSDAFELIGHLKDLPTSWTQLNSVAMENDRTYKFTCMGDVSNIQETRTVMVPYDSVSTSSMALSLSGSAKVELRRVGTELEARKVGVSSSVSIWGWLAQWAAGLPGQQGPKGDTGSQGSDGYKGSKGRKGVVGAYGKNGDPGPRGKWDKSSSDPAKNGKGPPGGKGPKGYSRVKGWIGRVAFTTWATAYRYFTGSSTEWLERRMKYASRTNTGGRDHYDYGFEPSSTTWIQYEYPRANYNYLAIMGPMYEFYSDFFLACVDTQYKSSVKFDGLRFDHTKSQLTYKNTKQRNTPRRFCFILVDSTVSADANSV